MSEKVTLRKLAAELNVVPATVLRALSGHPNVRYDLRRKILQHAVQRGYSLPNHRTKNIAIVISSMTLQGYLGEMLKMLDFELHKAGFHTFILTESDIESLNEYEFEGILSTTWIPGFETRFPKSHTLPVVSVNTLDNRSDNIYSVISDDFSGIMNGMSYLYQAGCRRIFFLLGSKEESQCSTSRENAFLQFCTEHNLPKTNFISRFSGEHQFHSPIEKALSLKADAIFIAGESGMQEVYFLLHQHGLRIPEDISVLGLETKDEGLYMEPPLTALHQNYKRLAKESVCILQKLIRHEKVTESIMIPFQFNKRESVKVK